MTCPCLPESARGALCASLPALALLALVACSGGGGGGGTGVTYDSQALLLSVTFPDPLGVNLEPPNSGPLDAPLNQQVVFEFSGRPDPAQVNLTRLSVRDTTGTPVPGTFQVDGTEVTFTPGLSTTPPVQFSATQFDTGGAGLVPGVRYVVRAGPDLWPEFVAGVAPALKTQYADPSGADAVAIPFQATLKFARFLKGLRPVPPTLTSVDPPNGATGVSPNLYRDPDGRFPPRQAFTLTFDAAVHPDPQNLGVFQLVDLDDTASNAAGLPLGIDVAIQVNRTDFAQLQVMPSGILPFGHQLSLEVPQDLRGLSQKPDAGPGTVVAATFTVADASGALRDALYEDFDTTAREESDTSQYAPGEVPAEWDEQDANVLTASFTFQSDGILGRFVPLGDPSNPRTIVLDTTTQSFPLFDGSTPDAPPGYTVVGGVFPFTTIDIPAGVIVQPVGQNPLVLTATGSVRIAGRVLLDALDGTPENAFDSAVTSVPGGPGGPGGGRGGEGHPILYAGGVVSNLTLVSPPAGGRGFGPGNLARIGGGGGTSGMLDRKDKDGNYTTDVEISCSELVSSHNNGWRGAGGGGGSMLKAGKSPSAPGDGNVLADGSGGWIVRDRNTYGAEFNKLAQGQPGDAPFKDADNKNDFIGVLGEHQAVFGGQGGGGGGSGLDAYYCGDWCLVDADPSNDRGCLGVEFPPQFAGSVGDSRGGGGGGGGGAFQVQALGPILVDVGGVISCTGGDGGGGEALGCGNWGGCGAGGSGGAILLESAVGITVGANATLDVAQGAGAYAVASKNYITSCSGRDKKNAGSGGDGSKGIIQLQVPAGQVAVVDPTANLTNNAWVDPNNQRNPASFSDTSVALSRWYDMGRVIARPPAGSNPAWQFLGTDPLTGLVRTDGAGNVLDPATIDLRCDFLGIPDPLNPGSYLPGLEPRADFIPLNASVKVEFQGAQAVAEGSKDIDPATITGWSTTAAIADGMQFLRYRITFDTSTDGSAIGPLTPRPTVQWIAPRASF